jgi:hypothetical protein
VFNVQTNSHVLNVCRAIFYQTELVQIALNLQAVLLVMVSNVSSVKMDIFCRMMALVSCVIQLSITA